MKILTVSDADIVTTLTPSNKPLIRNEWLKRPVHINAMGADAPGKQEFNMDISDIIDVWVVDDIEQARHSGETQYTAFRKIKSLADELPVIDKMSNTLFDATGVAIQDIAVAKYVYEQLQK